MSALSSAPGEGKIPATLLAAGVLDVEAEVAHGVAFGRRPGRIPARGNGALNEALVGRLDGVDHFLCGGHAAVCKKMALVCLVVRKRIQQIDPAKPAVRDHLKGTPV